MVSREVLRSPRLSRRSVCRRAWEQVAILVTWFRTPKAIIGRKLYGVLNEFDGGRKQHGILNPKTRTRIGCASTLRCNTNKDRSKHGKPKMKDELKRKMAGAVRGQNGRRRESEKAAAFLRENGAIYIRGVYHKRSGWWWADNVFLGARSIGARAEFERLKQAKSNSELTLPLQDRATR